MKRSTENYLAIILAILLALFWIVVTPFAIIWALNTLFPVLAIPYTFWHWLAVVVLNLTWLYKPVKSNKD